MRAMARHLRSEDGLPRVELHVDGVVALRDGGAPGEVGRIEGGADLVEGYPDEAGLRVQVYADQLRAKG